MLKVACSGPGVSRGRNLLVMSLILYQCTHHYKAKQCTRLASKLSHSLQRYGVAIISDHVGLEPAASIHSSQCLGALGHVGGIPHLSPRVLPFTSVTHFLHGLLLIL